MTHTNEEILALWARYWSINDKPREPELLISLFTEDCYYEDVPSKTVVNGKDEFRTFIHMVHNAFSDFQMKLENIHADEHAGFMTWMMYGVHTGDRPGKPATGKAFAVPGSTYVQFRDGKIAHNRDFYCSKDVAIQMGILSADVH
ncbi:MAG: ester cyclase [Sphingobium sp.]|nr:ester cyclase [Sphingobium sp.]MCP5400061.1 ester cyclase [Sphingomonas sp.]